MPNNMTNMSLDLAGGTEDDLGAYNIFAIALIVICLVGTAGNSTVIIAVFINKRLRTLTNYLLLNLSIADLLVSAIAIPFRIVNEIDPRQGSAIPCNVILGLTVIFDSASRTSILLIAFERFIAIKWPFKYKTDSTKTLLYTLLLLVWLVAIGFGILPVVGVGLQHEDDVQHNLCFFHTSIINAVFVYLYLILFCLLPLAIIVPINFYLLRASFKQIRASYLQRVNLGIINPAGPAAREAQSEEKRTTECSGPTKKRNVSLRAVVIQSKVARMVTILVGAFAILVAPISIIDLLEVATNGTIAIPSIAAKLSVCMIYTNAVINVFIYAGFNTEFRGTFRCMFLRVKYKFTSVEQRSCNSHRAISQSVEKSPAEVQMLALRFQSQQ